MVRQRVDVAQLVAEVLSLVRPSYIHAGIELDYVPPTKPLWLRGDRKGLRQLVTNLVLNAADAAVAGTHRTAQRVRRPYRQRRRGLAFGARHGSRSRPGGLRSAVRVADHDQTQQRRAWACSSLGKSPIGTTGGFTGAATAKRPVFASNFRWDRRMNDFRTSLRGAGCQPARSAQKPESGGRLATCPTALIFPPIFSSRVKIT